MNNMKNMNNMNNTNMNNIKQISNEKKDYSGRAKIKVYLDVKNILN